MWGDLLLALEKVSSPGPQEAPPLGKTPAEMFFDCRPLSTQGAGGRQGV